MDIVEMDHIQKSFGAVVAVKDVSLHVKQGEYFGLLGPNGAGKTTTIRILLDIFKPDHGSVSILGGPMNEAKKDRIGYMPEERGLYQDQPLEQVLTYLASLKGMSGAEIHSRLNDYLERFELAQFRRKKVKELSKGMQQKAQIIVTMLHHPELLIIDEPFSGLDPVNAQMVKELLHELHEQGTTIIMSSHQMHQVEELCDRILLINHGEDVLHGALPEIRKQFSGNALWVQTPVELGSLPGGALPGVERIERHNGAQQLTLQEGASAQAVLRALVDVNVPIESFEIAAPTLDEIFIRVVKEQTDAALESAGA